ncbi:TPA: hypothetical protein N0F65_005926 [Lagenidium giganteum]|uniref:Inositol hexakisphosphate and diphosphoinositol-pentakisphosphate kinase n=1 Tax=Lagenidium giganteum TaxID=4803 RepID=A0AAV2ZBN9_9STRA|nr:TPA: hypothetical protein N0F65_005926 [Lagenidium giganteum]
MATSAKYTIGVCAMEKKARSKPMTEILARLPSQLYRVHIFGDDTILNAPIEEWPRCDVLLAFFSSGFPLAKAQAYVELRQPVVVNDLSKQFLLFDRRDVYRVLEENDIPLPRHVVVTRDGYGGADPTEMIEGEDYVEVNGVRINKPFVEKPVDGENHNIYIYYPMSAGGGCKRLFRKVGNRSSEFDPQLNTVRRNGSFIYEEFLSTQGTDVKVYTVGPNYAHAEARKSPVLDGRVLRDADGKEVRYPVILSTSEKEVAYKVCRAFGQTICGFDILRVQDMSCVCDVNGWSFVKNSEKYYDDCAVLLAKYFERLLTGAADPFGIDHGPSSSPVFRTNEQTDPPEFNMSADQEELRCVLAVIRHGDRTPKQKMKMHVCHPIFLQYYELKADSSNKKRKKDLKIKAVADMEQLLQVSKELMRQYESRDPSLLAFIAERELKCADDPSDRIEGYRTLRDVLERWELCGINRKVQLKPREFVVGENGVKRVSKLLLIVKWGGDLTHSGVEQAEKLGQQFRQVMYPGGGLIRLHSTYRHDLKIYTSDEGRVQKTAASFAKGLLELEGDIVPILVGLVLKSKDADSMLDQSGSLVQEIIMRVKQRLHTIIHRGDNCSQLMEHSQSRLIRSVAEALTTVDQPIKKMEVMHKLMKNLLEQLTKMLQEKAEHQALNEHKQQLEEELSADMQTFQLDRSRSVRMSIKNKHSHRDKDEEGRVALEKPKDSTKLPEPCGRESLEVMRERWAKLYRDFYVKKRDTYDLSKIPDIHDCIRYDALHNDHMHLTGVRELLDIAAVLSHSLVPQEYGINIDEKVHIGSAMCRTLLMKINDDLDQARGLKLHTYRLNPSYATDKHEIKSTHRSVRTRLYFTSESHLHTLLNVLRYGRAESPVPSPVSDEARKWIEDIPEFCYMTHFVLRVFERFHFPVTDPRRFRLEISLSPGADQDPLDPRPEVHFAVAPRKTISREGLTCQELVDYFADAIEFAQRQEECKCDAEGDNIVDEGSRRDSLQCKRSDYFLSGSSNNSDTD